MPLHMSLGFLAAGIINIGGTLLFTRGFSSNGIGEQYPEVFAPFGMIGVMLWGLAYLAVCRSAHRAPTILLVFAIEKLVYTVTWFYWLSRNDLSRLWDGDSLVALFYTIYGPNDAFFCAFFTWCWWRLRKTL